MFARVESGDGIWSVEFVGRKDEDYVDRGMRDEDGGIGGVEGDGEFRGAM